MLVRTNTQSTAFTIPTCVHVCVCICGCGIFFKPLPSPHPPKTHDIITVICLDKKDMVKLHLELSHLHHLYLPLLILILPHLTSAVDPSPKECADWLFPSLGARIYSSEKRGTYFGYSVASYVGQSQAFSLVGAPKARNTYDFLEPDPIDSQGQQSPLAEIFGNTTGVIYRLNLDMEFPDCSRMPIADNNEDRRLHGTLEPGSKSNQLRRS